MQLLGIPSKKVKFEIQAFFIQKITGNQILIGQKIYNVYVSFRKCEVGEIYVKISDIKYECSPCGDKYYSLQNPIKDSNQACKSCPEEGAVSCINSKIVLQSGYWRKNNFSDIIIKCANRQENCHGKEQDGYCIEGYIGPLCEVCDSYGVVWGKKYGYLGNYLCNQYVASKQIICQTLRRLNVLIIGKTGEKDQISFYIKLFINYVQVTSIIQNSIFNFFDITFIDISSIFGSPSSYLSNSLDCFFSQTNILPIEYLRGIWVSIQPFFYILVAIVLFTLSSTTKLNQQKRRRFFYAAYIFGFIAFQCNTATQLVLIMSCSQIGDVYYIKSQLNKECYTQEHLKYTLYFILPLFLFWVIIITLFILWRIRIKRNKLTEPIQLYKYGFICGDYKTEYFYWEFLRILLRLSIVLVGNIFAENLLILKSNFAVLMIQIYNYHLIKLSPYINKNSLKIDYYFNQCICLLFLLNPISYYTSNVAIYQTAYIAQFIINLICYAMFLLMVIGFVVNKNEKINKYLTQQIPFLNRFLQKPFVSFKRFQLWKKVKKHFDKYKKVKKDAQQTKKNSLRSIQPKISLGINEKQPHDNNQNTIDLDFNTPKNSEKAFINLKSSPDFYKSVQNMKSLNSSLQSPIHSTRHIMPSYQKSNFKNLQKQEQNKSSISNQIVGELEQKPSQKEIEDKKEAQRALIKDER
ncbi:transmembrane protein, putative (macronuclear) [Tetrahymena thermophila SB210]|uniref:Transmembrane protein, putative n=1 Tax=Tetrahymena thermophila (strain SB210) TaxID=312017 RepID=W7XHK0_TETTS|nr:transmembrane protein, putative [Tetrahymena thermophila SB210]EWS76763.1 transmembrane protein, putative [Tetrahymena thermophila SB210]|eukprot:XP_012650694.1 transmembrane protein, putative [Tetrahymena thermophila SB210]